MRYCPRPGRRTSVVVALLIAAGIAAPGADPGRGGRTVPAGAAAQRPAAYWVFFHPAAVRSDGPPALAPQVLARRIERHGGPLDGDRPLPADLTRKLEIAGADVRLVSRWLRAVSVSADPVTVGRIRRLPEVRDVVPVAVFRGTAALANDASQPGDASVRRAAGAADDDELYGELLDAVRQIGVPEAHALGLSGLGVRIAILDTGFEPAHEALAGLRVVATRDFIDGDTVVSNEPGDPVASADHGTWVWSVLGGYRPGRLVGPAYGADFALARVEDVTSETRAEEDRWVAALEWADSLGATIVNSSLGYRSFDDGFAYPFEAMDGATAVTSRAAAEAARRGILIVNAMGNVNACGVPLCAPADADSIVSVGAVDSTGRVAAFSSRGPTADGRVKPEVAARGVGVPAASARRLDDYDRVNGTSLATPLIAGAAALVSEAWPQLTPQAARRALMLSGTRAAQPDNDVGHGVPNVASAVLFPEGLEPLPLADTDASGRALTLAPTFAWSAPVVHPAARPIAFRLEIGADSTFTAVDFAEVVPDAFSIVLPQPLRPAPRLYWRVTAETAPGVHRTSTVAGPFAMPAWVRLVTLNSPGGGFTASARPVLTWSPLPAPPPAGPLTFDVQVLSGDTREPIQTMAGITDTTVTVPAPLMHNVPYRWRVIAWSPAGVADTVESAGPFVVSAQARPPATLLYQNFPNPFPRPELGESATRIWFDLQARAAVDLAVYDLRGRLVRRLIPANGCASVELEPGLWGRDPAGSGDPCVVTTWDGRDDRGEVVARGVYLLRLVAGGPAQVRRIVFLPD